MTDRGKIPLGPRTSNLVLISFDEAMVALAEERALVYTRYADDVSFSSNAGFDVSDEVETASNLRGFNLNACKTKIFKHGQPMFVTGLAISDELRPRLVKRLNA